MMSQTRNIYDEPKLDENGVPICEECGCSFDFLLSHVAQAHGIPAKEYKEKYNLHPRKSVMSEKLRQEKKDTVYKRYEANLRQLAKARKATQFKEGNKKQSIRWEREADEPKTSIKDMIAKMAQSGGKKKKNGLTGKLVTKNE